MSETGAVSHEVLKVASRKSKTRTVYTVTCACGVKFESVASEGMARSYHSGHRKVKKKGW